MIKKLLTMTYTEGVYSTISFKILTNLNNLEKVNSQELADLAFTTQSTISKFVRKIGFNDFQEFKQKLLHYRDKKLSHKKRLIDNKLISEKINTFTENINNKQMKKFAELIESSNQIIINAAGGGLRSIREFYTILKRLGYPIYLPEEFSNRYSLALRSDEKTLVICISNSLNTTETLIPTVLAMNNDSKVVYFSSQSNPNPELKSSKIKINIKEFLKTSDNVDSLLFGLCTNVYFALLANLI
ncbi:MurR/RpiR family transcriptional regulator [Mycoplasmopsis pullorum]|uniref:MurR/RpiR family transcriptional regulator n=3 Tax=Mycoplasmopsis pullorum TaxID=48003 RepID=UPI0015D575FB|nr:MurR/RpiR family transcriptional regulator [Mycoplasmopsis pullorum]